MQQHSIYKRKAGVLFMDTRPVYFGKKSFHMRLRFWAGARSHEMLSRNEKTAINEKSGNRSFWNGFRLIFTSSL